MFTKQQYEAIVDTVRKVRGHPDMQARRPWHADASRAMGILTQELANMLEHDNSQFDRDRFSARIFQVSGEEQADWEDEHVEPVPPL